MKKFVAMGLLFVFITMSQAQEPWLPKEQQDYIKNLLTEKNIPVPETLMFYQLPQIYQNMYTMSSRPYNDITPLNETKPWVTSGGLHHIDKKYWRNVVGLAIPKGKTIRYYQEMVDVRAFALVHKHRWRFPEGTLAYDVLIRRDENTGLDKRLFEVRIQEKEGGEWSAGTVYRPHATKFEDLDNPSSYTWRFANGMEGSSHVYPVASFGNEKLEFAKTRRLLIDEDRQVTPPDYVGAGLSCNACHSQAGAIYDVPGRIYRQSRQGDDGRFSWHPFNSSGQVDPRWPINGNVYNELAVTTPTQGEAYTPYVPSINQSSGNNQMRRPIFGRRK